MAKQDLYTAPRKTTVVQQEAIEDNIPTAQDRIHSIEVWYENNKKIINNTLIAVLAIGLGYWAYNYFLRGPKVQKSNEAIYAAQSYFGMDSINFALNGDGNHLGFLKIIDKFGGTPAGNLAHYYAGVCYLKKGEFKNAEKHLKEFDGKGTMVEKVAKGALGDALMEQGKTDDAIKYYLEASDDKDNMLLSPLYLERAAMANEIKNNKEEAIKLYKRIKLEFPQSQQSQYADRNLARLGEYKPV
ncbi:MAG: tetratricopeptide repeat protein [Chitinophagaceae bacterium]|nr:tetratricopeptide repeat protein [Chitinophagaceae bacterium]